MAAAAMMLAIAADIEHLEQRRFLPTLSLTSKREMAE
jgi:hypothetical protein